MNRGISTFLQDRTKTHNFLQNNRTQQSKPLNFQLPFSKVAEEDKENYHLNQNIVQKQKLKNFKATKNKQQLRDPINDHFQEIMEHLKKTYRKNLTTTNPLKNKKHINKRMRGILFNWIYEIHHKFKLKTRTLFLTCNIFDRYLEHHNIPRDQLQLLGITAFFIASKFEDIYPPELDEFCYLCENIYSKKNILDLEGSILSFLNFDLIFVSTLDVIEQYFWVYEGISQNIKNMSILILKLFLLYSHSGKFNSFKLSAFAIDFSYLMIYNHHSKFESLISPDDKIYLQQKLTKIIQFVKFDKLASLEDQYKALFIKLSYSQLIYNQLQLKISIYDLFYFIFYNCDDKDSPTDVDEFFYLINFYNEQLRTQNPKEIQEF